MQVYIKHCISSSVEYCNIVDNVKGFHETFKKVFKLK